MAYREFIDIYDFFTGNNCFSLFYDNYMVVIRFFNGYILKASYLSDKKREQLREHNSILRKKYGLHQIVWDFFMVGLRFFYGEFALKYELKPFKLVLYDFFMVFFGETYDFFMVQMEIFAICDFLTEPKCISAARYNLCELILRLFYGCITIFLWWI